jgi:hypothetical protein
MIANSVVIGKDERDAESVRGDSGVGQGLIIAARKKTVAVLLVLVDLDTGLFTRGAKDRAEISEIESGERRRVQPRSFIVVGATRR